MGVQLNESRHDVVGITIDVASVAANTTAEQTFSVPGLLIGDFVAVNKSSLSAGLGVVNARVSAANTLALQFVNATAGAIDPGSQTYVLFAYRPEVPTLKFGSLRL